MAQWLELLHLLHLPGGDALALGLVALDGDKRLGVDLEWHAVGVGTSEGDEQAWVNGVGEQQLLALGIVANIADGLLGVLHQEALEV